ncbi:MAG: hypothetical protein K2N34_02155 [Lachnospiraceae bacterium]|nr:hypothetical protein [Lachnospiraceae bacterium]
MKKIFYMLITLAVLFSFTACNGKTDDTATFQAIILEIHDGYYLVEPIEGSAELNSADQITVPITDITVSSKLKVGDILEIVYDGAIAESYPAQITNVYSIGAVE